MIDFWDSSKRKKRSSASVSFLLLGVSIIASIASGESSMDTLRRTLPAYTVALNAETTLNSSACSRELGIFRNAVDIGKLWALRVLDSSGEPKPGFIYGNNYWLGSRAQCFDTENTNPLQLRLEFLRNASRFRKIEDEFPPFKLNYFVAYMRHNSTLQYNINVANEDVVILGLCLPAVCSTHQLGSILKKILQERALVIGELYRADFKLDYISDLQDDHMWLNGRMILVGIILIITLLLMIAATAYDIHVHQKCLRGDATIHHASQNDTVKDDHLIADMPKSTEPVTIKRASLFVEALMCFSIYTNTKIIVGTKLAPGEIGPIHGLRFFAMLFIIELHTIVLAADFLDNKPWGMRLTKGFLSQLTANGFVTVDTFFFISGFLMAYPYFKPKGLNSMECKTSSYKAKVVDFFGTILKRFIRLTPAYMMSIGLIEILSAWYSRTSIFTMFEKPNEICDKYWWRNLLYIHNLFQRDEMCLLHSWYLSNDMQFYVLGTLLVILSSTYFYTAVTILIVIFLSSTFLTGYISYINGYAPTVDDMYATMDIIYYPPWARIGPYIVGIVTAYILARLNNKLTIKRRNLVVLWLLGSACNLTVFFGLEDRRISVVSAAFYTALTRTAWGIGIGWILIACCTNHGGVINTILSCRLWIPLSRLTYAAYLINPFVIKGVNLQSESALHGDFLPNALLFFGTVTTTYICGFVLSLMMEVPYLRIVRLFVKYRAQHRLSTNQAISLQ